MQLKQDEKQNKNTTKSSQFKIMICEDEEMLASLYKLKLENNGYTVDIATDGQDALDKFDNHDLITLDIIMPKLDGFAVLKKIRETSNVPILILTNLKDEEEIKKGMSLGATDYLYKGDYTPNQLLNKIKEYV